MIVAVVMVLQRIEGCSDREAVDRFSFDARWKYAAGGLDFDYPGFVHTVLVDMRARLARSANPNRIFEVTLTAAQAAGLVGRRRVLDSTPLYDAVATMDTVTLIRSAIRGVLAAAGPPLEPRAPRGAGVATTTMRMRGQAGLRLRGPGGAGAAHRCTGRRRAGAAGRSGRAAIRSRSSTHSDDIRELDHLPAFGHSHFVRMEPPVIAAVNGTAAGAGVGLAAMADLALCGKLEVRSGLHQRGADPDGGTSFLLPRVDRRQRTMELLLLNRPLNAHSRRSTGDW